MVKVRSPLTSSDAAGRLASTLIFQHHKKGISLKKLTKPKQPRTPLQHSTRALIKRIGAYWASLYASSKAQFEEYGKTIGKDGYRAYLYYNLLRWRRDEAPCSQLPSKDGQYWGYFQNFATSAQGRRIYYVFQTTQYTYERHVIFWAKTTSGQPADFLYVEQLDNCGLADWYQYLTRPMPPGTYYCHIRLVDAWGRRSQFSPERDVTIG